jgi:hypothetical protein
MVTTGSENLGPQPASPSGGRRQAFRLDDPSGIVVGDWLRDLGRFRCVRTTERVPGQIRAEDTIVVRFVPEAGIEDWPLGFPARTGVTVWRDVNES